MHKSRSRDGASLNAAEAAEGEAQAAAHRETPSQKRARISELEERAELFGDPVKQSAQVKVLKRKLLLRTLLVHGEDYGFSTSAKSRASREAFSHVLLLHTSSIE